MPSHVAVLSGREMVDDAHRPAWVRSHVGANCVGAISFLPNSGNHRRSPPMNEFEPAMVALASRRLGRRIDCVATISTRLSGLGIPDRSLQRIIAGITAVKSHGGVDAR